MPRTLRSLSTMVLLSGLAFAPVRAEDKPAAKPDAKPAAEAATPEAKPAAPHANPAEGKPPPVEGIEPAMLPGEAEMVKAEQKAIASYMIGYSVGQQLKENLQYVGFADFVAGLKDAKEGNSMSTDKEEGIAAMKAFHSDMKDQQEAKVAAAAKANKTIGEAYYHTQKARPEMKATPSGLLYEVLKEGTGDKPKASDRVTVHYEGTLVDGTIFDSSYKRGQTTTFPLNGVIKGWTEGLQLMTPGSKYRFILPPVLAYGERGAGPDIGPDSTLTFVVELVGVAEPKPAMPGVPAGHSADDGHGHGHSHGAGDGHNH